MPSPYSYSKVSMAAAAPVAGVPPRALVPPAPNTQCPPPCPACGGLECLCRPRFFPGQVLTDDDLNRLENYVVAKNRLHNRYFQGSGVVCGLEVVCDACNSGNVTVTPGYALSPCGDDIIVCNNASVSICDLINQCKPPQNNCDPYSFQQPVACTQGLQQWVLSICYQEKPSRGVQPLMSQPCSCKKGGGSCGCGASCGGSGSCGCGGASSTSGGGGGSGSGSGGACGCGGKSTGSKPTATSMSPGASTYNAQCEPTLICEGFSFTATRYVDPATQQTAAGLGRFGALAALAAKAEQFGPLLSRLMCCYVNAIQIRESFANQKYTNSNSLQVSLAYSEYVAALRDFAAEHLTHRCDLMQRLMSIDFTVNQDIGAGQTGLAGHAAGQPAGQPAGQAAGQGGMHMLSPAALWQAKFTNLNAIWLEIFRECFCSALLPPCPDVSGGNCVPLAVVTINANTCAVVEICNWTAREFALTLPSIFYWTSFIQWGSIKDSIAKLCCGELDTRLWEVLLAMFTSILNSNAAATGQALPLMAHMATAGGGSKTTPGTAGGTGTTGGTGSTGTDGGAITGVANETLLALSGFLKQATMPDGMARLINVSQSGAQTPAGAKDLEDLKSQLTDLQKTVSEQSAQIAALRRR